MLDPVGSVGWDGGLGVGGEPCCTLGDHDIYEPKILRICLKQLVPDVDLNDDILLIGRKNSLHSQSSRVIQ
jgi:hypothetical protein